MHKALSNEIHGPEASTSSAPACIWDMGESNSDAGQWAKQCWEPDVVKAMKCEESQTGTKNFRSPMGGLGGWTLVT